MLSDKLVMILLGIAEACPHLILKSCLWSAHTTAAAGIQGYRSTVLANAVWAGPVSALRWVPLSAYADDGKPATCSKGLALQWVLGIVRWGRVGIIQTRYRQRHFSTSLQETWRTDDFHWPTNEDARLCQCPYLNMLRKHKVRLTVLWLLSASELQTSGPLR
jgi:hypothetical protein